MRAYGEFQWPPSPRQAIRFRKDSDLLNLRGTGRSPASPLGLRALASSGKVSLDWEPPAVKKEISGWRIYQGTESNFIMQVPDLKTTHAEIALSAGTYSFFVSSVSSTGKESSKIQVIVTVA